MISVTEKAVEKLKGSKGKGAESIFRVVIRGMG